MRKRYVSLLFLICLSFSLTILPVTKIGATGPTDAEPVTESAETYINPLNIDLSQELEMESISGEKLTYPSLDRQASSSWLVADLTSGEVLLGKNIDDVAYPASMTKILTCLTVLKHPDFDPDREVVFSEHAVDLPSWESVRAGFVPGERATTRTCLYALMVGSCNDCARALAETYGGTEEAFCQEMNAYAQDLGCQRTHYTDASGFGGEDHHTSARDIMTMMAEGLKNDFFRDLINCRAYVLPETEVHPYAGWSLMRNTNPLMAFANVAVKSRYFTDYSGGKTGSTGQAGECLTALAKSQDGREFLAVVFNSQIEEGGEAVPYERGQWCLVMLEQVAKALDLPEISSPAKNQNTQADAQASPVKSTEGSTPVPNPPAIDQQKVFSWDFLNKDLYLTPLWLLYALLAVLVLTFLFLLYLLILAKRRKVTILKLRRYINQGPSTHHHLTARRIQDRRR